MSKLMKANFARLRRDKIYLISLIAILIYAVVYMLIGCRQASVDVTEYHYTLDAYYFHFAISVGAFISVFSSMFFGTEYSEGTLRNKVIAGYTRTEIYLSNLLCTFAASMVMVFVWMIGAMVGIPALGLWESGTVQLLLYFLITVLLVMSLSAIFTLVNTLSTNKAACVFISMLVFIALLIVSSVVYNRLGEPEMTSAVMITADGMDIGEPAPNPNYISGTVRKVFEFIVDFLPTGQGLQMAMTDIVHPLRKIISSLFITISVSFCGIFIFNKKDLK